MGTAEKKTRIIEYSRKQVPKALDFKTVKTDSDFYRGYNMHDIACTITVRAYRKAGYVVTQLGVDLRYLRRTVIVQRELPDFIVEKGDEIFCFDSKAKSHTRFFGIVNGRAAQSYRQFATDLDVPVFINFVGVKRDSLEPTGQFGFCNILDEPKRRDRREWNGNLVWDYDWQEGLACLKL